MNTQQSQDQHFGNSRTCTRSQADGRVCLEADELRASALINDSALGPASQRGAAEGPGHVLMGLELCWQDATGGAGPPDAEEITRSQATAGSEEFTVAPDFTARPREDSVREVKAVTSTLRTMQQINTSPT